jgi:hypothetical protein
MYTGVALVYYLLEKVEQMFFIYPDTLLFRYLIKMMYQWVESVRTCLKMITEGIIMFCSYSYNFVSYDCLYDFYTGSNQLLNGRLEIFVCGDQIRKGAALNAVQIAEMLLK